MSAPACSCSMLGLASCWAAGAAVFGLVIAGMYALGGEVNLPALAVFVVGAVGATVLMIARRALQVSARRLGYYPTPDGGVVLREEVAARRRPAAPTVVSVGAPRPVIDGVRLDPSGARRTRAELTDGGGRW